MTQEPIGDGDVVLRPVTEESRPALELLRVSPPQRTFVSSVTDSLAEAKQHLAANPLTFGLYDRETPVGFVMIADEVDDPDYIAHYLWKSFAAADFGFTDPNDTPANAFAAVTITSLPAAGSLTYQSNAVSVGDEVLVANLGDLVFTPAAEANGTNYAHFNFKVRDNGGTANGG